MMDYETVKAYLKETYQEWKKIYEEGSSAPHYTDGYLLNSCRIKILGYKESLSTVHTVEEELLPEEFFMETPPEVPEEYMARTKEIWIHALEAYQSYLENEDYQYLTAVLDSLDKDIRSNSYIDTVIGYVKDLRDSFLKRDYVYLRTHEKGDFIEIFSTCRKSIEEMKQKKENHLKKYMEPEGQLSLFGNGIIQERNR